MFKDLDLSRESMRDYHSRLESQSAGLRLTVMVLQRSAWPFTVQKSSVDIPLSVCSSLLPFYFTRRAHCYPMVQMQAELTAYMNYYKQRHSGHALDWDHALGTVTMKARFGPGSKELSLSLYQAVVLLLFNESPELRYPDILERTRMGSSGSSCPISFIFLLKVAYLMS